MCTVRASGKPIRAAKCEKSPPMAKVAEVNTQAQGRDSTYSRSRSAISKGVYCSSNPFGLASTHRSPVSSDCSRKAASELASVAARRAQFETAAPAPRPSRRDAMSLMPVWSSGNASTNASRPALQSAAQFLELGLHGNDCRGGCRIAHAGRHHLRRDVPQQKLQLTDRP